MRAFVVVALALIGAVSPLHAQKPQAAESAPRGVRERVLEKLRAIDRASRPGGGVADSLAVDSAGVATDSVAAAADSIGGATAANSSRPSAGDRGVPGDTTRAAAPGVDLRDARPAEPASPFRTIRGRPGGPPGDTPAAVPSDPAGRAGAAPGARVSGPPGRAVPIIVHVPPDSLEAALRRMDGYVLTEYRADVGARYEAGAGKLELSGSPSLAREGQVIRSDSLLVYDEPRAILCAYGKPVLEGTNGAPVESQQVCYAVDQRLGVALGARTQYSQGGGTWFVHGKELYTREDNRIYGANAEFTTCDLEEPHFHFAAKSVKIVHKEILVARDVTLRFRDVPVFWLPFLVQSMKDGRRSGLLTPEFSITDIVRTRRGYDRSIRNLGFYWAINDYMGTRVAFGWWSDHWLELNGALQYRWDRQFLNGGLNLTRYWEAEGRKRLTLSTQHSWRPDERTSISINGNFTSAEFLEQYSFDPRQLDRTIGSNASLNRRFDWGTLNIGANRQQYLTQEQTITTVPSVTLTLTPITLFRSTGEARWYNNATWNGRISYEARSVDRNELLPGASNRDTEERNAQITSSFSLGNFSWSQSARFTENVRGAKPWFPDPNNPIVVGDTALDREVGRSVLWNSSLSYTQRLIGTSTFSPSVSLGGEIRDTDRMEPVVGPTRVTFQASLNTNIFGFWPGFGPFSRLRHRIDPSISYTYSPVPTLTPRQIEVFGEAAGKPTNRLSIGLNQTWEAKYADADTVPSGAGADTLSGGAPGEPRRLPQARKITLLSLSTSALVYDFTKAQEGDYGFETTQIHHTVRSDLLEGLSLSFGYDLFEIEPGVDGGRDRRTFSPSLRSLNASFSLDSNSWLFRVLGLGRQVKGPDTVPADSAGIEDPNLLPPEAGPRTGLGPSPVRMDAVGSWRANLEYSLSRPGSGPANQLLRGSISFQPTERWNVQWRTGYSFTDGEFSDHYLVLTRDLHRWQANFIFTKTRTGNLMFSFRVDLQDLRDLKVEYDERYEGPRRSSF